MTSPQRSSAASPRAIGMAMLGSALALGVIAALTIAGVVPVADDVRPWVAAGLGLAAVLDVAMALFFLRKFSQS